MSSSQKTVDPQLLDAQLKELRVPEIHAHWSRIATQSDREGWPFANALSKLVELELDGRDQRRIERHLKESRLLLGKTLDGFDFSALPSISKSQVMSLSAGRDWLEQGTNILMFGPPGVGKSHLACGIGRSLIEHGFRVMFFRTNDFVQRLQRANQDLQLEKALAKFDKYHLLILDDFVYTSKNSDESGVLFELINTRYERRSILITANQPFEAWDQIFPDPATMTASADRLIHHSVTFELSGESYRRREAKERYQSSQSE